MKPRMPLLLTTMMMLLTGSLRAQGTAHLSGVVRDGSGAVIRDATITAVNTLDGTRRSARSDAVGQYLLTPLRPGTYKVLARKPGFQTAARLDLELQPDDHVGLDFPMVIGSVREVITITSGGDPINENNAVTGGVIQRQYFDMLPANGRTFTSLLDLVPALVVTPASAGEPGQFSVAGQRPNTNYFTVDGLSANASVTGSGLPAQFGAGALPAMTAFGSTHNLSSLEAVSEVRVETSTFAPEHGRMPGAQIALHTRAGSNQLHGAAYFVGRHEALGASEWFANSAGLSKPAHRLGEMGASLGGPLRRDRTFFFADALHLRLSQPYVWRAAVPSLEARRSATGPGRAVLESFPLPNYGSPDMGQGLAGFAAAASRPAETTNGSLRIDHALSSRVNLFGRYNQAPSSANRGFANREQADFAYRSLTIGATGVPSATVSYDLRWNLSSASADGEWIPTGAGGARPPQLAGVLPPAEPVPAPDLFGVSVQGAGEIIAGRGGRNRQGQASGSAALDAFIGGTHRLRLGVEYQRLTPSRERPLVSVAADYGSVLDILNDKPPVIRYAQAEQASSLIETLSLYAQDIWRPTPSTSITYGVRWEITPAPSIRGGSTVGSVLTGVIDTSPPNTPVDSGGSVPPVRPPAGPFLPPAPLSPAGAPELWPTRYRQVAPRLGIAHRLREGTTLRAGWGVFYNLGFSLAADPINGFPFNRWQFRSGADGTFPTTTALSGGERAATGLQLPLAHHWNVAIEQQFPQGSILSVSYIGSAGRRLLRREGELSQEDGTASESFRATNHGASDYHGLAVQYRRPLSRRVQATVAYTWSHAIDNGSWDSNVWLIDSYLSANSGREQDRASASFDVRHSATAAFTWDVFRKWRLSGLVRARGGFPIDVLSTHAPLGFGFDNAGRPDLVEGKPVWLRDAAAPGGWRLNPDAFMAREGLGGGLGRNALRGFGLFQSDVGISRQFAIGEGLIEFRADAMNVLNRASFADPVRFLDSPLFGQSVAAQALQLGSGSARSGLSPAFQSGGTRTLQFTVRFRF